MRPGFSQTRQILFFATAVLLLTTSTSFAQRMTNESEAAKAERPVEQLRKLTEADVDPKISRRIFHNDDPNANDEWTAGDISAINMFRDHVLKTDYGEQKASAHRFMAIRRRIQTNKGGSFNLLGDLAMNPEDYTGHPIILFGLVEGISTDNGISMVTLLETTGERPRPIAQVEFKFAESDFEPTGLKPVLVCAYPVRYKKGNNGDTRLPYMVAQRLEWVRPNLAVDDLDRVADSSRGIPSYEADAYYETLKRARLLDARTLYQAGLENRDLRIDELAEETKRKSLRMAQRAELHRSAYPEDIDGYNQMVTQADDYLAVYSRRYERYAKDPSKFPLFVDIFKNPDWWTGKMVTLTGRVRKIVEYPPSEDDLGLGVLYEIWLYTDDSQRNPAVYVCTSKPKNIPSTDGTNVIENVTISGYFFKRYRYTAEDAHRLAPMLLGQTITWNPQGGTTQEGIPVWLKTLAIFASIVGFVALMMYVTNFHDGDRRFRQKVRDGSFSAEPLDLEIVDGSVQTNADLALRSDSYEHPRTIDEPLRSNHLTDASTVRHTTNPAVAATTYVPENEHWIGRERIIGQKIRTVLRLAPSRRETDIAGQRDSPTIVVLKNGYRFELAESELRPAGPGVETGQLTRMKQRGGNKSEQFLGAEISNVLVDQLSNVYLILDGNRYLAAYDMPNDDSVRAPLLTHLFESREVAFSDYWSQTPISRSQLRTGLDIRLTE